ncbi:hypothetical protein C8034_v000192 [Colletotrichum sidae]|uniref:Uncharacterized protein n=1 Tax=Colletotrichum sidae TaxID=1347389 RepID=A0A4R8TNC8_9PEZI|nr:hypothetical protein C8034_v000192 [Colletotrichum sidae]
MIYRILGLLVIFYSLWPVTARERASRPFLGHISLPRDDLNEANICGVNTCGAADKDAAAACGTQLNARVLGAPDPSTEPSAGKWYSPENYEDSTDNFFRGEVAKLQQARTDIVPLSEDVTSKYVRFTNQPRSVATLGFYGCIGIIVMSNSAVWMAHVVETLVRSKDDNLFKARGLDVLRFGASTDEMHFGLQDLANNVFHESENPIAIVFAPKGESGFLYRSRMAQIDQLIYQVVGIDTKWFSYFPKRFGEDPIPEQDVYLTRFVIRFTRSLSHQHRVRGTGIKITIEKGQLQEQPENNSDQPEIVKIRPKGLPFETGSRSGAESSASQLHCQANAVRERTFQRSRTYQRPH